MRDTGTVTRRALLIGSETYGLQGCDADVALMRDVLGRRGFDAIEVRTGTDAGRAGIVDGLDAIAGSIGAPDDAVVVYYSGHGGRVVRPDFEARKAAGASVHFQFIVPFDMEESDTGDFRGVLSEELTSYQRRMTDAFAALGAVPNVTTILDCCHSGYMARALETTPKSVDLTERMFRTKGVRDHVGNLADGAQIHGLATNAHAVRLAACQPEQSAFEFPSPRGGRHGALTDALASVLDELGEAPASWGMVGDLVSRRVRTLVPEQHPVVEGPADRLPFSDRAMPDDHTLAVSAHEGDLRIEAAEMLGIAVDDEFRLVTAGQDDRLATGIVDRLDGGDAVLRIDPETARDAVSRGALAVPERLRRPRTNVHLELPPGVAPGLADRLVAGTHLAAVDDPATAMVRITSEPGGLVLNDHAAQRWRVDSYADDDAGIERLVSDIEAIAVGHRLLDLPPATGPSALDPVVTIDVGVYRDGRRHAVAQRGHRFAVGDSLYLTLVNTSSETLFLWVFDVGVSGRSALLTNAAPSGTLLGAHGTEDDSADLWDLDGEQLVWPADVPTTATTPGVEAARWERFVVLVADQRANLSSLASRPATARSVGMSPLEALVGEARSGVRDMPPANAAAKALRYRVDTIEFLLDPP